MGGSVSGYLVVRNLLSPDEVATFNTIVDANADRAHDAGPADDYLTGTPMEGQHGAFVQYTDVLRWPEGQCQPFRELMVHPNLRPVLNTIFGRGWRIETEEVLTMTPGSDGLPFHGKCSRSLCVFFANLREKRLHRPLCRDLRRRRVLRLLKWPHALWDGCLPVLPDRRWRRRRR